MTTIGHDRPLGACPACGQDPGQHSDGAFCSCCLARASLLGAALEAEEDEALDRILPSRGARTENTLRMGDYELIEELGRGGMGVVFKARQASLDRIVAIKTLLFGGWGGASARRRFQTEAAAAAALDHPGIVRVFDVGEHDGQPFLAMEYVPGRSLAEAARVRSVSPREAAGCVAAVSRAVEFAHSRGVLHRDLKPSNVVLDEHGKPRITDFGLAKWLADGTASDDGVTLSGQALGSPNYLPPEQSGTGDPIDVRSDVYGLGAILYHLLTGRPPFQGASPAEVLVQVRQNNPLAPRQLNPSVPADLETICLKCLEKDPAKRYPTAQTVAEELDRFLNREPIHARPVSGPEHAWRWCRRNPALAGALGAAALFLVAGVAGVLWQWRTARQHAANAVKAATRAEANELTARRAQYASDMTLAHQAVRDGDVLRARQLLARHRPGSHEPEAGSPERRGDGLSFLQTPGSRLPTPDLRGWEWGYLWRETQGDPHRVVMQLGHSTGPLGLLPGGKTAFVGSSDKMLRFLDLESGREAAALPHLESVHGAAASPDGRWLVTATRYLDFPQPIRLWDLAARSEAAVLATNLWPRATFAFSPDSRWIAFFQIAQDSKFEPQFRIWDVESRQSLTNFAAFDPGMGPMGAAFSPDGRWLLFAENDQGSAALLDTSHLAITRRWVAHEGTVREFKFSPNGKLLASAGGDGVIKLWDFPSLHERARVVGKSRFVEQLAFSTDGQWLAASSGSSEIWLLHGQTGERKAVLQGHLQGANDLVFTADGTRLLSTSGDGSLREWTVPPAPRPLSTLKWPANIETRWVSYGPAIALAPDASAAVGVLGGFRRFVHRRTDSIFSTQPLADGLTDAESAEVIREVPAGAVIDSALGRVMAAAPGGRLVAFGSIDGRVEFMDVLEGSSSTFKGPGGGGVNRMAFSRDGSLIALANSSAVSVWSVSERRALRTFSIPDFSWELSPQVMSLAFSMNGRHVLAGYFDGSVRVYPLSGGGEEAVLRGHESQVRGLAMLADDRTVISAATELRVWDRVEARPLLQLSPRPGGFLNLALTPDGRRLAAGSVSGLITIWDTASWQEVATLNGHADTVHHLAFSADGQTLLSASRERLHVWRAEAHQEIRSTTLKPTETTR